MRLSSETRLRSRFVTTRTQAERERRYAPPVRRDIGLEWCMLERITHDPQVLAGRATVRGLRISVAHVVNLVANGMTAAEIVAEYPDLEEEDVRQALAYAAAIAEDQLYPIPAAK